MDEAAVRTGDIVGGRYRVGEQLGEGGMGAVWDVADVETGKAYALKVVLEATGEHVRRFDREVKAMMRIESEHVVKVIAVGAISEKVPFMVMERLEGETLKTLAPLGEQAVADLFLQACEGLAHAHALGIVHRDVKSSNLFVLAGPARDLKVLDFGIARATSYETYEQTMTVTDSAALLGSPQFISPEQLQSPSNVDERADIWSLGVTMYHALTGDLPFNGSSLAEILVAVMSKQAAPLFGRCEASPAFITIVERCLDRDVGRRYRRLSELADDLAPFATVPRALLAPKIREIQARAPSIIAAIRTPRPTGDRTISLLEMVATEPARYSARSPRSPRSARSRGTIAAVAFGIGLAVTLSTGAYVVLSKRFATPVPSAEPLVVVASVPVPVPVTSAPAPEASDEPDDSLELVADAPITRVIKPPSHHVELEDGKAVVVVGEVKSDIPIEVELANGGRARGVAHAGGDRTIKLATSKSPARPHPAGKPNSELHNNPY